MKISSSCLTPWTIDRKPMMQPNTKWMSEEGNIVFYVNDDHTGRGTMNVNGKVIDILVRNNTRSTMYIYPIDAYIEENLIDTGKKYETWVCTYKSKKEFVAEVYKTTFFKKGQKIKFYRVDDEEDTSN